MKRRILLALILIILIPPISPIGWDEYYFLPTIENFSRGIFKYTENVAPAPLSFLLYSFLNIATGSLIGMRILNIFIMLLIYVVSIMLSKLLFSYNTKYSGYLSIVFPPLFLTSHFLMTEPLFILLMLLYLYAFFKFIETRDVKFIILAVYFLSYHH
jgi:hypothetical protein